MNQRQPWLIVVAGLVVVAVIAAAAAFAAGRLTAAGAAATPPPPTPTAPWPTPRPTRTPTSPPPSPTPPAPPTATPTATPTPAPTPRVSLLKIQDLGRLESTDFVVQATVPIKDDPSGIWERVKSLFGTDELLLVATGEAIAGFDLQKLQPDDVVVAGDSVRVTLPPAEILVTRVDNQETYVYSRSTGLLWKPDKDLETTARRQAEDKVQEWALEHGILDRAEQNGKLFLENFLRSLGFTDVTLLVRPRSEVAP